MDTEAIPIRKETKRSHFIPQLLLRGFASRVRGKEHYVYVFRRDAAPIETNIRNVAVARFFYGRSDEGDIESGLNRVETQYANLVARLRAGTIRPDDSPALAEFISHLIVRTANLRAGLDEFGAQAMDFFEEKFASPEGLAALRAETLLRLKKDGQLWKRWERLPYVRREAFLQEMMRQFREAAPSGFQRVRQTIQSTARKQQLATLARPIGAIERTKILAKLSWSVLQQSKGTYVLGDVGPIARFEGAPELDSAIKNNLPLNFVSLPISCDRCLVGRAHEGIPIADDAALNAAAVELSREFFVSSTSGDRELGLVATIGVRSRLMSIAEMEESGREIFGGDRRR